MDEQSLTGGNGLKRAAEAWAEQYGRSLLSEAEEMRREGAHYAMSRADKAVGRVASRGAGRGGRAWLPALVALAACLVIVFRIASVWDVQDMGGFPAPSPSETSNGMAAPSPSAPSEGMTSPAPAAPSDSGYGEHAPNYESGGADVQGRAQMILLAFEPPGDYRVAASGLDNGLTVYEFEGAPRGDVVLTVEHADAGEDGGAYGGMDEVVIDGARVPAKITETYRLLAFEDRGLRYTLSSEDDLGALAAFYRSIVAA